MSGSSEIINDVTTKAAADLAANKAAAATSSISFIICEEVDDDDDFTNTAADLSAVNKAAVAGAAPAMVTEATWLEYVNLGRPHKGAKLEPRNNKLATEPEEEPADSSSSAKITKKNKETVPDAAVEFLRNMGRPLTRMPPVSDKLREVLIKYGPPETLQVRVRLGTNRNCCVDLHEDVLRQHDAKGFAEVGVHFADDGVKHIFVLPPQPQRKWFGSGGFAAVVFALLVVLISWLLMMMSRVSIQV